MTRRRNARDEVLRVLAVVGLLPNAVMHVLIANGDLVVDGQVTVAGLFLADAIAAAAAAVWLAFGPGRLAWVFTAAVTLASLLAVVVTAYVLVPSVGPLPAVYEPFWYAEKYVAAGGAGAAFAAAAIWLATRRR